MSEKIQHTAAHKLEKMAHRYNDEFNHKHDKTQQFQRHHCRSHPPVLNHNKSPSEPDDGSTGLIREHNLKKIRKRKDRGHFH